MAATPRDEVVEREEEEMKEQRPVVVISRESCSHCRRAMSALEKCDALVEELSLSVAVDENADEASDRKESGGGASASRRIGGRDDDALFNDVRKVTGKNSVPQIFVAERPGEVLGADELIAELEQGRLQVDALKRTSSRDPLPKEVRVVFDDIATRFERHKASAPASSSDADGDTGIDDTGNEKPKAVFDDIIVVNNGINKFGFEYGQLYGLCRDLGDGSSVANSSSSSSSSGKGSALSFSLARSLLKRGPPSFTSAELISWLQSTDHAPVESAAIRLGQRLLYYNFIAPAGTYAEPGGVGVTMNSNMSPSQGLPGSSGYGNDDGDVVRRAMSPSSSSATSPSSVMYDQFPGKTEQKLRFQTFMGHAQSTEASTTLNLAFPWPLTAERRDALTIASELRMRLEDVYASYLSADGRRLDYAGIKESVGFRALVDATCELQTCDLSQLSRDALVAFFINVYNILIVHATTVFGTPDSLLKRLRFFDKVGYTIGGLSYSANDIEHGVLRANAPSPAALASLAGFASMAPKTFKSGDPRCALADTIGTVDPRVHFALVCGAKSCPPIRIYDADNLELGLDAATRGFLEDDVIITEHGGDAPELRLSVTRLFSWYAGDFGGKKENVIAFIRDHIADNKAAVVSKYMAGPAKAITINYKSYDWTINDVSNVQ